MLKMVAERVFKLTEKGSLRQNERNALRSEVIVKLAEVLKDAGVENSLVKDGIVIELTNETLGSIPVVINVTMKDLQFDVLDAITEYENLQAERLAKLKAKKEKTE